MKETKTKNSNKAFSIILVVIVILVVGFAGWLIWYSNADPTVKLCDYKNLSFDTESVEKATDSVSFVGGMFVTTTAEEKMNQKVLEALVEESKFHHIKKAVDQRYDEFMVYYQQMAGLYEYSSVEELAKEYYGYDSLKAFTDDVEVYSKTSVRQELVLSAIAEKEGFTVTDEIFDEYIKKYLAAYDYGEDEVEAFLNDYGKSDVYEVILNDYTLDKVAEWNDIK